MRGVSLGVAAVFRPAAAIVERRGVAGTGTLAPLAKTPEVWSHGSRLEVP